MSQHLVSLSLNDVIARFALSFALAMVVAYLHEFVTNARKNLFFFVALVSISLIVTMLMITIDERLPRALGLFAALAIIRFRMPVKNIQDIIFIFFAIAVGISCGTGAGRIASVGTAIIAFVIYAMTVIRGRLLISENKYILEASANNLLNKDARLRIEQVLTGAAKRFTPIETIQSEAGSILNYEIWCRGSEFPGELINLLNDLGLPKIQFRLVRAFSLDDLSL